MSISSCTLPPVPRAFGWRARRWSPLLLPPFLARWRFGGAFDPGGVCGAGSALLRGRGGCPPGPPLPHPASPRLGLALRAAAFVSRGAGRLVWALPRPLCPARALQMGKPDAVELGEGIVLGGSLCGGATPNPLGVVPGPGYCGVEARSAAAWVFFAPRLAGGVALVAARQVPSLPSGARLAVRHSALRVSRSLYPRVNRSPRPLTGNNRLQLDLSPSRASSRLAGHFRPAWACHK